MIFDPMYFLFVAPAMLLAGYAQMRVSSAYNHASQIPSRSGLNGAQVAQKILMANGIGDVGIEETPGKLSDHYDPQQKMLRLSSEVYRGNSLASLGIAAHEVGHALQDNKRYAPLVIRNAVVPLASFGSSASWIILGIGAMIQSVQLILLGILLFSCIVVFQLVNLPVEYDASARAKKILLSQGFISDGEKKEVDSVLNAAALTYVAATLSSVLTLLYYLMQTGLLGGGERE